MRKLLSLLLVVFLLLTFVGCKDQVMQANEADEMVIEENEKEEETQEEKESEATADLPLDQGKGMLLTATSREAKTLNPHEYTSSYEKTVLQKINGRLYSFYLDETNSQYSLRPDLADGEPVQVDEAGKVWQIKVSKDAKWANGEALKAGDFYYSWKMLLDPKLLAKRGATFAKNIDIVNGENYYYQLSKEDIPQTDFEDVGIKLIDDYTIEITSNSKQTTWDIKYHMDEVFSSAVYQPLFEANMNEDRSETTYGTELEKFMSAGPFELTQWLLDSESIYMKNVHYIHKDLVWIAGIKSSVIEDSGTQMQLFESGALDYVKLSADDFEKYQEDPRVLYQPGLSYAHISVNTISEKNPILGNVNFRKALYHAMDRERLAGFSKNTPAGHIVVSRKIGIPSQGIYYRDTEAAKANVKENFGYDEAEAKRLFELALSEEGLEKVTLELLYYDSSDSYKAMSEYLQQYLPALFGEDKIELSLTALPSKQLTASRRGWKDDPNSFDIAWAAWSGSEFNPWYCMVVYTQDWYGKNEPYLSDAFDALYEEAMTGETIKDEPMKRVEITAQMENMLFEELPFIPVYETSDKYLKSDRLELAGLNWVNGFGFGWHYSKINE